MNTQTQEVYDTKKAAELLGIAPVTVRQHINNGTLRAKKLGNGHIIMAEDLKIFEKKRRKPGRPSWLLSDFTGDQGLLGKAADDFKDYVNAHIQKVTTTNPKKRFRLTTAKLEKLYQEFVESREEK